jgi:hypothetical protein
MTRLYQSVVVEIGRVGLCFIEARFILGLEIIRRPLRRL